MTKTQITRFIFWPLEIAVCILILVTGYSMLRGDELSNTYKSTWYLKVNGSFAEGTTAITALPIYDLYYSYGMILGLIALTFFTIALTPGILGRFGVKNKFTVWLMLYRREFGKLMFLFALAHYLTIKIFPMIALNSPLDVPLYQTFGFLTFMMAFFLFVTSNNYSQSKLGIWWNRIHGLVYVMVWTIFLHVALRQGFSLISLWVFVLAFAEMMSLANYYLFRLNLEKPKEEITSQIVSR